MASLVGVDAASLRDVTRPAAGVFPDRCVAALERLDPAATVDELGQLFEASLAPLVAAPDPEYLLLLDLITAMIDDRSIVRVDQVERLAGVGARRLQRLFARYVGVGPKWVLARYRIHDAVSELDAGIDGTIADLANRYGWFDQAHFSREFRRLIGVTPSEYAQR